eukprot:UN16826
MMNQQQIEIVSIEEKHEKQEENIKKQFRNSFKNR